MGRKSGVLDHWDETNSRAGYQTDDALLSSLLEGTSNRLLQAGYRGWVNADYKNILDVGAGLGRWAIYFRQISPLSQIYAAEYSPSAIARAKSLISKHGFAIKYCCADAFNLPFGDNLFDLVHSFGLIEDYPNYMDLLAEQWRVLRPGGRLICVTLHKYSWHALYKKLFGERYYSFSGYEHDFPPDELVSAFRGLGLENIELSYADPMHRITANRQWRVAHLIESNLKRVDWYLERKLKIPIARYWSHDIYVKGEKPL